MKIKFKKILKLLIALMSPLLVGLSVVPIITSCSKSEEGLIISDTEGRLNCDEKYVQVVNGKNCIIVPYKYETTVMDIQNTFTRDYNITELYLPVGKYTMRGLAIDFQYTNDNDFSTVNKINWYNGFDKYGNPNIVDPKKYSIEKLTLELHYTSISTLGNIPKCEWITVEGKNSALVSVDVRGAKKVEFRSFENSRNLQNIYFDIDTNLLSIPPKTFYNCSLKSPLFFPKKIIKWWTDGSSYSSIGEEAFVGTNNTFTDVYFSGSEEDYEIAYNAFNSNVNIHYNYQG